jgi:trehalose synthase
VVAELHTMDVPGQSLDAHEHLAGREKVAEIRALAGPIRGRSILYVSAVGQGGGVAEMLRSLVPLLRDAGVDARWANLFGDADFLDAGRVIGDAVQGGEWALSEDAWQAYLGSCASVGEEVAASPYDVIVVSDAQPAPLIASRGGAAEWIWRCHVDASEPDAEAWDRLAPFVARFDSRVFSLLEFVPEGVPPEGMHVVAPGIDPLSPKNADLPWEVVGAALRWIGVDLGRPLICQVARFDPWKDPLGTIEAWRLAKREVPDLQLALVGSVGEDPEAWRILREVAEFDASGDDLYCLTDQQGIGDLEVNALQRLARCAVQRSLREGFGLAISEALFKRTPVIAQDAGGAPVQLRDGLDGYLADSPEQCARRIVELVADPGRAAAMGRSGRERVIERFLITRLVADELRLLAATRGAAAGVSLN